MRDISDILGVVRRDVKGWLHDIEWQAWRQMSHPRRADSFLAGRVLAKRMLCSVLDRPMSPRTLLITSPAVEKDAKVVSVFCGSERLTWQLSLAHSRRFVGVVVFRGRQPAWGLDIVDFDEVDESRLRYWMTDEERQCFRGKDSAVCWSVKEAAFKTLNDGSPFEPHSFCVKWGRQSDQGTCRWTAQNGASGTARVWSKSPCTVALAALNSDDRTTQDKSRCYTAALVD